MVQWYSKFWDIDDAFLMGASGMYDGHPWAIKRGKREIHDEWRFTAGKIMYIYIYTYTYGSLT